MTATPQPAQPIQTPTPAPAETGSTVAPPSTLTPQPIPEIEKPE